MKTGNIISEKIASGRAGTQGEFYIDFDTSRLGPYTHLFKRENLYFDEDSGERGSFFFPLKSSDFENTEIFLETNDIVVCIGIRGSFSGSEKQFVEIVNLKTQEKCRFYPDEVSLIYNTKDTIVIYYKKSKNRTRLILDIQSLQKISETSEYVSAFFKLLYNHTQQKYGRLIFYSNNTSAEDGYFEEIFIDSSEIFVPIIFHREDFRLKVRNKDNKTLYLDVWEASLTGEL